MSTHPKFETDEQKAEYLKSLIVKGQKILAIHFVRESEKIALAEAKEKVEAISNELSKLPEGHPDRPIQRQGIPGWVVQFIIMGVIVVAAVLVYLRQ